MTLLERHKRKLKIVELVKQGLTDKQVAKLTNMSVAYVGQVRRENCGDFKFKANRITPELMDEMIKKYQQGVPITELATCFHISTVTVTNYLKKYGAYIENSYAKSRLITKDIENAVIQDYINKLTVKEISIKRSLSTYRVRKILDDNNIQRRVVETTVSDEMVDGFIRLQKQGMTVSDIAGEYNVSPTTVSRYLRKNGIEQKTYIETIPVFTWDSDETYCYDCADDCKYYSYEHCTLLKNTIFKDRFGQREVCKHYISNED